MSKRRSRRSDPRNRLYVGASRWCARRRDRQPVQGAVARPVGAAERGSARLAPQLREAVRRAGWRRRECRGGGDRVGAFVPCDRFVGIVDGERAERRVLTPIRTLLR
jgi:hypothetical protein